MRRLRICLPLLRPRCGGCALTSRDFCHCRLCLISICAAPHFNWPCGASCSMCLLPRPCLMVPWRSAWPTDGRALRWVCVPWRAPWGATLFLFSCRVTGLWVRAVRSEAMPAEWSARWRCWHTRESGATAAARRTVAGFLATFRSRSRGVPAAGFCCGDCARKSGCSLSAPAPGHKKSPRDLSIVRGFVFHLEARRRHSAAAVRWHQTTPCAIMALATFMKPATLAPRT